MSPTNDRDAIRGWLGELLNPDVVEEGGAPSMITLVHYDGMGRENDLHNMKPATKNWGDAEKMADIFDGIATRHARGLSGAQQFQLAVNYGSAQKPTKFLPFLRSGALSFGPMPGGGLATEPPTAVGQAQQGMRMGEMVVQGMIGWARPTYEAALRMIEYQGEQIVRLSEENRELFIALRKELIETVKLGHEQRMQALKFIRDSEERRKIFKLVPALVNATTGREIFPVSVADTSIVETLASNCSEEEVKLFSQVIGKKSPELSGLLMNRFREIQVQEQTEREDRERAAREIIGIDPEDDAAGAPTKLLRAVASAGQTQKKEDVKTTAGANGSSGSNGSSSNGGSSGGGGSAQASTPPASKEEKPGMTITVHAEPTPDGPKVSVEVSADSKLLDDLIKAAGTSWPILISTLSASDPGLAERLQARARETGFAT